MTKKIGLTIRMYREAMGLTQVELALKLGCSQKHLNRIEMGHIFPNWIMLNKALSALNLDLQINNRNMNFDLVTGKFCAKCKKLTTHKDGKCIKNH